MRDGAGVRSSWPYRLAFSALVAGVMSLVIGSVVSWVRAGPEGWAVGMVETGPIAFATAFPVSLFVVPAVQRLVDRLFGLAAP